MVRTGLDEGDRIHLSVQDVGTGLEAQDAEKLFRAFYTTKSDGMGIGLSVSRTIIESHGGQLWAQLQAMARAPPSLFPFRADPRTHWWSMVLSPPGGPAQRVRSPLR